MRTIKKLSAGLVLSTGTMLSLIAPASANLVTNGSFDANSPGPETAPLGWTFTPASSGSDFYIGAGPLFGFTSAPNAANFGATGSFDDVLSQVLTTTPGQSYTITFELAHDSTNESNDFTASFGGTPILTLVNQSSFAYTLESFTATATSGTTTLSFAGREVPSWFELDDVDVEIGTPVSVPEPGSLAVFGAALLGLGMLAWRKRKTA